MEWGAEERDEEKTGARGGEEGRLMYGVYLFADTDKHEQNQHPDTEPGQSESVLIVELIDPTKLISRYSAKSPRYCSLLPPLPPCLPSPSSASARPPAAPPLRPAPFDAPSLPRSVSYPSNVHVHGGRGVERTRGV